MDKQWYLSKTIWGAIISVIGKVVVLVFGVTIDPATTAHVTDAAVAVSAGVASLVGDALAIYGRTRVGK